MEILVQHGQIRLTLTCKNWRSLKDLWGLKRCSQAGARER
jgi:hypothetical protein